MPGCFFLKLSFIPNPYSLFFGGNRRAPPKTHPKSDLGDICLHLRSKLTEIIRTETFRKEFT